MDSTCQGKREPMNKIVRYGWKKEKEGVNISNTWYIKTVSYLKSHI